MKSTQLIAVCSTFAATAAQLNNGASPGDGFGPGPKPDVDAFQQANRSPNATGAVVLQATNMSADGNTGITVPWVAHLNVTEVTNLNYTSSPTEVITNSVISIDTLGSWVEDSYWDTTLIIFKYVTRSATVNGQKDSGDCYSTLGEECVDDYLQSILLFGGSKNNTQAPTPPASCKNRLSATSVSTKFQSMYSGGNAFLYSSSELHNASNTTSYEQAATRVWPIVLIQTGHYGPQNNSGITTSSMSCLRANATAKGSVAIKGVPGAAGRLGARGWFVLGVVGLVSGLLA